MEAKLLEDVLVEPLLPKHHDDCEGSDFDVDYDPEHAMTQETEAEIANRLLVEPLLNTNAGRDYSHTRKISIFHKSRSSLIQYHIPSKVIL